MENNIIYGGLIIVLFTLFVLVLCFILRKDNTTKPERTIQDEIEDEISCRNLTNNYSQEDYKIQFKSNYRKKSMWNIFRKEK